MFGVCLVSLLIYFELLSELWISSFILCVVVRVDIVCCFFLSNASMLFFVPYTTVCNYFPFCIIIGNVMQTVTCITIDSSILIEYFGKH